MTRVGRGDWEGGLRSRILGLCSGRKARLALCAVGLLLFGYRGIAEAQVKGTPGDVVANQAAAAHNNVYGTVGMFERDLLPALPNKTKGDPEFAVWWGQRMLFSAARVPDEDKKVDVDLYSTQLALGMRAGRFSFFYGGGLATSTLAYRKETSTRFWYPAFSAFYGSIMGLAGHFAKPAADKGQTYDWGIGAGYNAELFDVHLGYLRWSNRLFSHVTQPNIRLFLASALSEGIKDLGYLHTGFDRVAIAGEKVAEAIGVTTLGLRKLRHTMGVAADPQADTSKLNNLVFLDRWTGELRQFGIGQAVDLHFSYELHPDPSWREIQIGKRFGYQRPVSWVADKPQANPSKVQSGWGIGLRAGVVQLPDQLYYGIRGGVRITAALDLTWGILRASISHNDTELLTQFPFAVDATHVQAALLFR